MVKPNKPREEPKLGDEPSRKPQGLYSKQWPKDEIEMDDGDESFQTGQNEETVAGALEHPSYKELEKKLTALEAQAFDQQLRSQAEMDNLRRRVERDVANAHKYALEKFVNDLLPVADSLDRALTSDIGDNVFARKIHEGIELTDNLLLKTLEKHGVKRIDPRGEQFNPELHQAISTTPSDQAPNTVVEVLQKGYVLNDRLIRPALVVVASE